MKLHSISCAIIAFVFAACSAGDPLGGVKKLHIATATRKEPAIFTPRKNSYFAQLANERTPSILNSLRSSIQREITASAHYEFTSSASGDAEIVVDSLSHGLIEVGTDHYAVQVLAPITVVKQGKQVFSRDFSGGSSDAKSLKFFEEGTHYEDTVRGVLDKIATELAKAL